MRQTGPLLRRLLLWQFVTLAATLIAFSILLVLVLSHQLRQHHDEEIILKCESARDTLDRYRDRALDDPQLLTALESISPAITLTPLADVAGVLGPAGGAVEMSTASVPDGQVRVASCVVSRKAGSPVRLQVSEFLGDVESTIHHLQLLTVILIPAVLVAALAVTTYVLHRALRPLQRVVSSVTSIGAENLDTRVALDEAPREIVELAQAFNQMAERLGASFAQVRRFTANASHELRTPLSALTVSMEVAIQGTRTAEEYHSMFADCLSEVRRLNRMVHNLLVMAQADSEKVKLQMGAVSLDQVLQESVDAALVGAEQGGLHLLLKDGSGLLVDGDSAWLRQMFDNLLDNAVKYTPAGGHIQVEARRNGNSALVIVQDTGPGVAESERGRIFERFHRAEQARSLNAEGVGLGLAIALWVAEAHGGSLRLGEDTAEGAAFLVTLPLHSVCARR